MRRWRRWAMGVAWIVAGAGCATGVPVERYRVTAQALEDATGRIQALRDERDACREERDRVAAMLQTCMDEDVQGKSQLTALRSQWTKDREDLEACRESLTACEVARKAAEGSLGAKDEECQTRLAALRERMEACEDARRKQESELVALRANVEVLEQEVEAQKARARAREEERRAREDYAKRWALWCAEAVQGVPGVRGVESAGEEVRLTVGVEDLFVPGGVWVSQDGAGVLRALAPVLAQWPGEWVIEGHSDALPVGENLKRWYPSNWELSAARAGGVVRVLVYGFGFDKTKVRAEGFADREPLVTPEKTPEDRRRNRRIVFRGTGLVWQAGSPEPGEEEPVPEGGEARDGGDGRAVPAPTGKEGERAE